MHPQMIITLNTLLFFIGWTTILFLGADYPPPIGFLWLVVLIAILDLIQYRYLQLFLPQLRKKKKNLFAKNLLFFTTSAMTVSLFCLASRYTITLTMGLANIVIWIAVLTAVGAIYGIFFWFFNLLLVNYLK